MEQETFEENEMSVKIEEIVKELEKEFIAEEKIVQNLKEKN